MRVAHLVRTYLPISQTFISTQLVAQRRLWEREGGSAAGFGHTTITIQRLESSPFPSGAVVELSPRARLPVRAFRRAVPGAAGHESSWQRRLAQEIRRARVDVVHAHFGWMGLAAAPVCRNTGVPLVTSFYGRDVVPAAWGQTEHDLLPLFDIGARHLVLGPAMAARVSALGAPPDRVAIQKLGLDLSAFNPQVPARPLHPPVLVQVGRLVDKKGADVSIRALAELTPPFADAELWLVGQGAERGRLEECARELGVAHRVLFLGQLTHDAVTEVMRRAHVGLVPSRTAADGDVEGTPTVALEFQALGVPVVATRHADIPAIVPFPDELVAENDPSALSAAIAALLDAPQERWEARSRAGRALVEDQHDAAALAQQSLSLYREVVAAAPFHRPVDPLPDDTAGHTATARKPA